jgi:hypothetical protein
MRGECSFRSAAAQKLVAILELPIDAYIALGVFCKLMRASFPSMLMTLKDLDINKARYRFLHFRIIYH